VTTGSQANIYTVTLSTTHICRTNHVKIHKYYVHVIQANENILFSFSSARTHTKSAFSLLILTRDIFPKIALVLRNAHSSETFPRINYIFSTSEEEIISATQKGPLWKQLNIYNFVLLGFADL